MRKPHYLVCKPRGASHAGVRSVIAWLKANYDARLVGPQPLMGGLVYELEREIDDDELAHLQNRAFIALHE